MSLVAQAWVSTLPLDTGMNLAAFRVLDKLADAHNSETGSAWRSAERIATELRCSKRTVQRALKDLQVLGFITRGNQAMLGHIRADRRPTVWTLSLALWSAPAEPVALDGVTADDTPSGPVDNQHGVTTDVAHGVTAAVTQNGMMNSYSGTSAAIDRATPSCSDGSAKHAFSRKAGRCVYCGLEQVAA